MFLHNHIIRLDVVHNRFDPPMQSGPGEPGKRASLGPAWRDDEITFVAARAFARANRGDGAIPEVARTPGITYRYSSWRRGLRSRWQRKRQKDRRNGDRNGRERERERERERNRRGRRVPVRVHGRNVRYESCRHARRSTHSVRANATCNYHLPRAYPTLSKLSGTQPITA